MAVMLSLLRDAVPYTHIRPVTKESCSTEGLAILKASSSSENDPPSSKNMRDATIPLSLSGLLFKENPSPLICTPFQLYCRMRLSVGRMPYDAYRYFSPVFSLR